MADNKKQPQQAQPEAKKPEQAAPSRDDETAQKVKDIVNKFYEAVKDAESGQKGGLFTASPEKKSKRVQEDIEDLIKSIISNREKEEKESRKAAEAKAQQLKRKEKADDFFKAEKAKIDTFATEMQTKIKKMYDDLDERRAEVLKAPEEDKKGLIDRFSGWMLHIYRNNVNELRSILGLPPKEEKKQQEAQKTAAETVVQQNQPQTQAQAGKDSKSLEKIIAMLEKQLAEQRELNGQLQKQIAEQAEKIKNLEAKLSQRTADQVRDNAAPEKKGPETVAKQEPAPKPAPAPKATEATEKKEPEAAEQKPAPEPQKKGPEDTPIPPHKPASQKIEFAEAWRRASGPKSPVTGEAMRCMAWGHSFKKGSEQDAISASSPVTPDDFVHAYIYTALQTSNSNNEVPDLHRIVKNAAETFRLALDLDAVAAPWRTESNEQVYAFSSLNFDFSKIYTGRDEDLKEMGKRMGLSKGELREFTYNATKMEDIIRGHSNMKLDVAEYRQMVESAARQEIAAKGLDEKEFDKLLNEARKAPALATERMMVDRGWRDSLGGVITPDGGTLSWREVNQKNMEAVEQRLEQERKNKGSKTQTGSVRG